MDYEQWTILAFNRYKSLEIEEMQWYTKYTKYNDIPNAMIHLIMIIAVILLNYYLTFFIKNYQ